VREHVHPASGPCRAPSAAQRPGSTRHCRTGGGCQWSAAPRASRQSALRTRPPHVRFVSSMARRGTVSGDGSRRSAATVPTAAATADAGVPAGVPVGAPNAVAASAAEWKRRGHGDARHRHAGRPHATGQVNARATVAEAPPAWRRGTANHVRTGAHHVATVALVVDLVRRRRQVAQAACHLGPALAQRRRPRCGGVANGRKRGRQGRHRREGPQRDAAE